MPFGFGKKPWQKVACNYALQEYSPGHGWRDITEPAGEIPRVDECREHFKPGCYYRLMARALEDSSDGKIKGGTFVGQVWKYYEPLPGGVVPVKEVKGKEEKPSRPKDATETMKEYVGEVKRVLEPITDIFVAMNELRDSLFPEGEERSPSPSTSVSEGYTIPPPEFDGKVPILFHPYVVKSIAEEVKGVIEFAATRFEGVLGKRPVSGVPSEAEEEEELKLPSISKYMKRPAPAAPEEPEALEEKEIEERVEEEEGMEEEEEVEEEPIEAAEEATLTEKVEVEVVPSLIGKQCANCGQVVALLPSGICEKCAKKLGEWAEEHEREEREAEEEEEEASE